MSKMTTCTLCGESKPMYEDHTSDYHNRLRAWEPFYGCLATNMDYDGPVCPACVDNRLEFSETEGYYLLKEAAMKMVLTVEVKIGGPALPTGEMDRLYQQIHAVVSALVLAFKHASPNRASGPESISTHVETNNWK